MPNKVQITYLTDEGKYVRYEAPDSVSSENMVAIIELMDGASVEDLQDRES